MLLIWSFIASLIVYSEPMPPLVKSALLAWGQSQTQRPTTASVEDDMQLHLFDNTKYPNAKCLDGSSAGYYFNLTSSENWVINLEGGGLCVEPVDCEKRKSNHLGSSKYWSSTKRDDKNVCSATSDNPFHDWNRIFVPYCTGDVHIGVLEKPDEFGFHFSGHHIITAVLDHLIFSQNRSVSQFLLTGDSAGGIGTLHNADYVGSLLSKLSPPPRYWAAPQGGFYFPSEKLILYPEMVLNLTVDFAVVASSYLYDFFGKPFLDESCTKAHRLDPHQCWNQAVHYPHISTNVFIAENMYDSNQIGDVLGVNWYPNKEDVDAYKKYFGETMRQGLQSEIKTGDGLFMPSCYEHTANLCMLQHSPTIQGHNFRDLLVQWMYKTDDMPVHFIDICNSTLPCNPCCTCPCSV